jgi:Flp pilus assembly protein TadG
MFLKLRTARRRREQGATSVVVIVLLVPVLFGAAALSFDLGQLLWERRQVQNGADAAVMRAASLCVETPTSCPSGATPALTALAGQNANDGFTTIQSLCGNLLAKAVQPALALCGSSSGAVIDCPTVPSSVGTNPYVEIRTTTKNPDGSTGIISKLNSVANGSTRSTTVGACARAAWGPASPSSLNVLPVTMSFCDWKAQTGYPSANYPSGPLDTVVPASPYGYGSSTSTNPWPASSWEHVVYTKGNPTTCPTWNGHTAPGGFATLDGSTSCTVSNSVGGWYEGRPGNARPCDTTQFGNLLGKVVYVPIFDCLQSAPVTITATTNCNDGGGSHLYYHTAGYAAFYLTGWYFSSDLQRSIAPSNMAPCNGGDRCMSGWFLKDIISEADLAVLSAGSPPNFGLTTVQQAG